MQNSSTVECWGRAGKSFMDCTMSFVRGEEGRPSGQIADCNCCSTTVTSLSKCSGVSNRPSCAARFLDKQDSDSQVSSPFGEAYSQQNRRWILDILEANLRMRKVFDHTSHSADFTTRIEAAVYSDRATQTFELAQLSDILCR
jgi:hypothetical protein